MDKIEELKSFGFEEAGYWSLLETGIPSYNWLPNVERQYHYKENVLYLFVDSSESRILYIGQTTTALRSRFNEHVNNAKLKEFLVSNSENKVKIFVMGDLESIAYHGIEMNPLFSLEEALIKKFDPEWNIRGKN